MKSQTPCFQSYSRQLGDKFNEILVDLYPDRTCSWKPTLLLQRGIVMFALLIMITGVQSCSSDGDGGPTGVGGDPIPLSGYVLKGAVQAASVHVRTISATGDLGDIVAGPLTTDASGHWSGEAPTGTEGIHAVTASGGSYTDEATGETVNVTSEMYGVIVVGQGGAGNVTPMTHAIFVNARYRIQLGASMSAAFTGAIGDMTATLGFDPTTVRPDGSKSLASAAVSTNMDINNAILAGFSVLLADNPALAESFDNAGTWDLVKATTLDLTDGKLDGIDILGDEILVYDGSGSLLPFPALDEDDISNLTDAATGWAAINMPGVTIPNVELSQFGHPLLALRPFVYVDGALGNDTNAGTQAAPLQTIQAAIDLALAQGDAGYYQAVIVARGTYMDDLVLEDPITLRGGYDATTWTKVPGVYSIVSGTNRSLQVRDIDTATTISGFEFQAANGQVPSASGPFDMDMASVSADVRNCGSELLFEDCFFDAGDGATGLAGVSPSANGTNGVNGIRGVDGSVTAIWTYQAPGGAGGSGENNGGKGGNGGEFVNWIPFVPGASGYLGEDGGGGCSIGGLGGLATVLLLAGSGLDASPVPGQRALDGSPGSPASFPGATVDAQGNWIPIWSMSGTAGSNGCGGGGGGGGGSCKTTAAYLAPEMVGAGGGGGGGGGGAGEGGGGGVTGGASFAVYLFDASPVFGACTFVAGQGGVGGPGGNGARGGYAGAGGSGGDGWGQIVDGVSLGSGGGGDGANGQDGGYGGGGAGAHGGPSYCVFKAGASAPSGLLTDPTNMFHPGEGGVAGAGGFSGSETGVQAMGGLPGPSGDIGG